MSHTPPKGGPRASRPAAPPAREPTREQGGLDAIANGSLMIHVPRSLHRQILRLAAQEGVTVQDLVLSYLAHYIGVCAHEAPPAT